MNVTLLARVTRTLEENQIPFALIGAAAMAAHGVSRSTYDTNLFSVGSAALVPRVWQPLEADGVTVELHVGDDDDPLLGVVRIHEGEQTIDLVLGRYEWQRAIVSRARAVRFESIDLPIVTLEDLILLKLYAGGVQDRWDIQQLIACASALRLDEIDARTLALPARCQTLWQTLRPTPGG